MPKKRKIKLGKKEGRKLFDGKNEKAVLSKLRDAWDIGATDVEACTHADISIPSLYRYFNQNPAFRKEKDCRKQKPILKARNTIFNNLDNPAIAKWFLERKCKNEFATMEKVKFDSNTDKPITNLADFVKTVIGS